MDICLIAQKTLMQNYAYIIPPQVVPPLSVVQCIIYIVQVLHFSCTQTAPTQSISSHIFLQHSPSDIGLAPRRVSMHYDIGLPSARYSHTDEQYAVDDTEHNLKFHKLIRKLVQCAYSRTHQLASYTPFRPIYCTESITHAG